uniref:Uncharacterized protein n=1 Tax=Ixodes scapularis TaxID=6945 RepID=A0A4D5S577_IXOSC
MCVAVTFELHLGLLSLLVSGFRHCFVGLFRFYERRVFLVLVSGSRGSIALSWSVVCVECSIAVYSLVFHFIKSNLLFAYPPCVIVFLY